MLGKNQIGAVWGVVLLVGSTFFAQSFAEGETITVYKSPTCGCCNAWIDHLKESRFVVESHDQQQMEQVKNMLGVPEPLRSCHTAKVGGYLIEGHVPASSIKRVLADKPEIQGLAVPGMPMGSPGMEGQRVDPYDVIAFSKEGILVYERKNQ